MTSLWPDEIRLIVLIQQLPGWLEPVMEFLSLFAREEFFLVLLPVLYWCVNPRLGLRVGIALLSTASINAFLKLAFHAARPYWIGADVKVLSTEASFGMPSGHAQTSVAVWGVLVSPLRSKAAWWAAGILALLVSFSRLYLGVHFVSDVVAGLLLGLLFLMLFLRFEDAVVAWWQRKSLTGQVIVSFVISGVILAAALAINMAYAGWTAPETWNYVKEIKPASLETLIAMSGSLLGTLIGASVMHKLGWFDASGPWWQRVLRFLVGSIGLFLIWYGLKKVLPQGDDLLASSLRYGRYALLSLWVQLGAPLLFFKLRLLGRGNPR